MIKAILDLCSLISSTRNFLLKILISLLLIIVVVLSFVFLPFILIFFACKKINESSNQW